jgi:hypothetical protein
LLESQLIQARTYLLCQWFNRVAAVAPSAPTAPDITFGSSQLNITVTWTNPSAPGSTNELWKSTDGVTFSFFTMVSGSATQASDATGMVAGNIWYYKVRSCNGANCSAFSSVVSASFNFTSPNVASINFPTLVRAFGTFTANGLAALTSVSLPALKSVGNNLNLSNNPNLTSVTLTALQIVVSGALFLGSNNLTGAVSLPALTSTTGDVQLQSNPLMTSFSAPLLTQIGGIGSFSSCAALASVTLTSLQTVGSIIGGRLDFNSDTSLTTLSLPALTAIQADFLGNGCTVLASMSIPQLIFTDGSTINFTTDALNAASINQILARGVASAVNTCIFSLAAGTNAAPSGQGVADKATLIGQGNTVTTN